MGAAPGLAHPVTVLPATVSFAVMPVLSPLPRHVPDVTVRPTSPPPRRPVKSTPRANALRETLTVKLPSFGESTVSRPSRTAARHAGALPVPHAVNAVPGAAFVAVAAGAVDGAATAAATPPAPSAAAAVRAMMRKRMW